MTNEAFCWEWEWPESTLHMLWKKAAMHLRFGTDLTLLQSCMYISGVLRMRLVCIRKCYEVITHLDTIHKRWNTHHCSENVFFFSIVAIYCDRRWVHLAILPHPRWNSESVRVKKSLKLTTSISISDRRSVISIHLFVGSDNCMRDSAVCQRWISNKNSVSC